MKWKVLQAMKMVLNRSNDEYLLLNNRDSIASWLLSSTVKHGSETTYYSSQSPEWAEARDLWPWSHQSKRAKLKFSYDHRHKVVEGEELSPGDRIGILTWKQKGLIKQQESPRSVKIQNLKWSSQKEPEDGTKISLEKTPSLTPESGLWEPQINTNKREEPRRSISTSNQPSRLQRDASSWGPTSSK